MVALKEAQGSRYSGETVGEVHSSPEMSVADEKATFAEMAEANADLASTTNDRIGTIFNKIVISPADAQETTNSTNIANKQAETTSSSPSVEAQLAAFKQSNEQFASDNNIAEASAETTTSQEADTPDPFGVGAEVPIVPAEALNRALRSRNPASIIENGWKISEVHAAENGREETYTLEKPTYFINDKGETQQGDPRKQEVPLSQIINWRNDANNLRQQTVETKATREASLRPETTPTQPEATESRKITVAELAARLEVEDKNDLAAEIAQELGHSTLEINPKIAEAAASLSLLDDIQKANALRDEREAAQANQKPVGLLKFLKTSMLNAMQRRLLKYNQLQYGAGDTEVTEETDTPEETLLDSESVATTNPETAKTDVPTQERELNSESKAELTTDDHLESMFRSLGLDKHNKNSEEYAALRKAFEEYVSSQKRSPEASGMTSYEQYKQEAAIRRKAAAARTAQRKQARQEFFDGLGEAGKVSWNNLKSKIQTSRLGRAARFAFSVGRGMLRGARAGARAYRMSRKS